jgi:hypothetical protein
MKTYINTSDMVVLLVLYFVIIIIISVWSNIILHEIRKQREDTIKIMNKSDEEIAIKITTSKTVSID